MKFQAILAVAAIAAAPVYAESHGAAEATAEEATEAAAEAETEMMELVVTGDAAAGEKAFKKCVTCHVVVNDAGETLAGKKSKTGPNLYGIAGGNLGTVEGFKYSKLMMAGAEAGVVFDEASFVGYVMDPNAFVAEATGESGRTKMSFRVRKEQEAIDLFAYLASLK